MTVKQLKVILNELEDNINIVMDNSCNDSLAVGNISHVAIIEGSNELPIQYILIAED